MFARFKVAFLSNLERNPTDDSRTVILVAFFTEPLYGPNVLRYAPILKRLIDNMLNLQFYFKMLSFAPTTYEYI